MKINEIFYSVQGEGIYQGIPMVFVRFQGCPLIPKCSFCDTSYAWDPEEGFDLSAKEVLLKVSKLSPYRRSWVCITGGEPLWQGGDLEDLIRKLKVGGYLITVETNGSFKPPGWYTLVDSWSADIKCPSSGVCGVSNEIWFRIRQQDQIKFVVGNQEDLDFVRQILDKHKADSPTVLVSPVFPQNYNQGGDGICIYNTWLQEVVEFAKEMRVRYSLQWHKIVYGNKKGV